MFGPRFDQPVAPNGYLWWYVDALSDDGRHGVTLIAFIGSVFSPYYAWARRRRPADPLNHCALNVALYGARGRWAMTERGRGAVRRDATTLTIGPSALWWDGAALTFDIDEVAAPLPARIRGRVRVRPAAIADRVFALDAAGRHCWRPIAPCARVEVALDRPGVRWSGPGYLDSNWGDAPLETAFESWSWSRASRPEGTTIFYDVLRAGGARGEIGVRYTPSGGVAAVAAPPVAAAPRSFWRIERPSPADAGGAVRVLRRLENAPFYSRSVIQAPVSGEPVVALHESVSLSRFRRRWVQLLLPFRMPRRWFR